MKAVSPTLIGTAQLNSSSIPLADYVTWASGTTYNAGARVLRTAADGQSVRIFESIAGGNIGHDPAAIIVPPATVYWLDIGPANRWAMFDQAVGTLSTGTGSITVTLDPGTISSLAVIDTTAETVRVVLSVSGTTLYDVTQSTNAGGGMIADWYAYFTSDVGKVSALLFDGLPLYSNCRVVVTITGADPGGPVSVGTLLVGTSVDLGMTQAGPTIGITDFSRKETDQFGVTTVVERAWAKKMTIRATVMTSQVDGIQRRLAALRAKPALYIGEEGFDSLTIYGFYKDFSIDLALANISYVSMTIEGLI